MGEQICNLKFFLKSYFEESLFVVICLSRLKETVFPFLEQEVYFPLNDFVIGATHKTLLR